MNGYFSTKSNVHNFGVLDLEIISGKKNFGFQHPNHNLNLLGTYASSVATQTTILAMKCLMKEPKHRPSVDELDKALEQIQELQKAFKNVGMESVRKENQNGNRKCDSH
ncbi:unnamed protein product [Lactuca saligna]|uniref:Serine-threonine/tyrosine-protein kinase catalytic domain-containing protein n=1 Tax=Lactuca saligna TaxID=75948 RepID=A0AA35ZFQ8_LACSI|nr:unnamed protein product [Lactuca saligna]